MSGQKQFFRIEGGAVSLVTERIERTVALDDLLKEIGREQGVITPILPTGCRLFHQAGDRSVFVIEQAPATRQVAWVRFGNKETWKLAFPYLIFVVVFRGDAVATDECRIFYRTSPLGNGDEKLLRVNLCNTWANARVCTGNIRVAGVTLAQKAESFVAGFWSSQFNDHIPYENFTPAAQVVAEVKSLESWEAASAANSLFVLSAKWLPFEGGTLADVIVGRC